MYIVATLGLIMLYNIGYINTVVIYLNSTVINKVIWLYNTEWWFDHGMAVYYESKKFYNIGPDLYIKFIFKVGLILVQCSILEKLNSMFIENLFKRGIDSFLC